MPKRHSDALAIQEGACNPIAVANTLARHITELHGAGADTPMLCNDPALRLICHQLAFLLKVPNFDRDTSDYTRSVDACKWEIEHEI